MKLIFFISCISFILSPGTYSFWYCQFLQLFFLINAYIVIKNDNEFFGFVLLFTIAFFLTNYIYPCYVYPIVPIFSLFMYDFDENVITKSTSIANVAYSSFSIGYYNKSFKKIFKLNDNLKRPFFNNINLNILLFLFVLIYIAYIFMGALSYYDNLYDGGASSKRGIFVYIQPFISSLCVVILMCSIYVSNIKEYWKINIIIGLSMLLLVSSGTRTIPLFVCIIILYVYIIKYNKNKTFIISSLGLGVIFLSLISLIRSGGSRITEGGGIIAIFNIFEDLIVSNRNIFSLYSYATDNGYTLGTTFIAPIGSVVPFAQGFIMSTFNIPWHLVSTNYLTTYMVFGNGPLPLGLGSNCVGDVYVAFGIIGIIIFFYMLGFSITYAKNRISHGSYRWMIFYLCMVGDSIYFCRAPFFDILRIIIWSQIIFIVFVNFIKYLKMSLYNNKAIKYRTR